MLCFKRCVYSSALCALLIAFCEQPSAYAQLSLTTIPGTYTIDFDSTVAGVNNGTFTGAGFQAAPTAGQLDSDAWAVTGWSDGALAFGGTNTAGDYARGTTGGPVTTGGMYGYDDDAGAGVNRGLGFQPGGSDWAPGTLKLRIQNNTGFALSAFDVDYLVYVRNDQARANSFNFAYSSDDTAYTPVGALDLTSTEALDALGLVSNSRGATITGLTIPNGGFVYLRWNGADVSGGGSRDEFVLDDIVLSNLIPEPSSLVLLSIGATALLLRVRRRRGVAR